MHRFEILLPFNTVPRFGEWRKTSHLQIRLDDKPNAQVLLSLLQHYFFRAIGATTGNYEDFRYSRLINVLLSKVLQQITYVAAFVVFQDAYATR